MRPGFECSNQGALACQSGQLEHTCKAARTAGGQAARTACHLPCPLHSTLQGSLHTPVVITAVDVSKARSGAFYWENVRDPAKPTSGFTSAVRRSTLVGKVLMPGGTGRLRSSIGAKCRPDPAP